MKNFQSLHISPNVVVPFISLLHASVTKETLVYFSKIYISTGYKGILGYLSELRVNKVKLRKSLVSQR